MKTKNSVFFSIALGLFIGLLLVVFTNCKKKKNRPDSAIPIVSLATINLTKKNWIMTSYEASQLVVVGEHGFSSTHIFDYLATCVKDNLIYFDTASIFTLNEGPTKCNPYSPQTYNETWAWNSNETALTISRNLYNEPPRSYNVITLDSTHLGLTFTMASTHGSTTYTQTYIKK